MQCVDEWLRVNASCPTCRQSIHDSESVDAEAVGGSTEVEMGSRLLGGGTGRSVRDTTRYSTISAGPVDGSHRSREGSSVQ